MNQLQKQRYRLMTGKVLLPVATILCILPAHSRAEGPLTARVTVTSLQSYSGSDPLPKPTKILVYDFVIDTSNVQVDQSQKMRPRHMISGDENPEAVAQKVSANFAAELVRSEERRVGTECA